MAAAHDTLDLGPGAGLLDPWHRRRAPLTPTATISSAHSRTCMQRKEYNPTPNSSLAGHMPNPRPKRGHSTETGAASLGCLLALRLVDLPTKRAKSAQTPRGSPHTAQHASIPLGRVGSLHVPRFARGPRAQTDTHELVGLHARPSTSLLPRTAPRPSPPTSSFPAASNWDSEAPELPHALAWSLGALAASGALSRHPASCGGARPPEKSRTILAPLLNRPSRLSVLIRLLALSICETSTSSVLMQSGSELIGASSLSCMKPVWKTKYAKRPRDLLKLLGDASIASRALKSLPLSANSAIRTSPLTTMSFRLTLKSLGSKASVSKIGSVKLLHPSKH
mmetsp:Transcript_78870/g.205672  ORF Transcript_78870/g.205672 Transcript_78870/m.205672 type:complete len:337 (-) Transcript_78870:1314-2324(-)